MEKPAYILNGTEFFKDAEKFPLWLAMGMEDEAFAYLEKERERLKTTELFDANGYPIEERIRNPVHGLEIGLLEEGCAIVKNRLFYQLLELGVPFEVPKYKRILVSGIPYEKLCLFVKPMEDFTETWIYLQMDELTRSVYAGLIDNFWHTNRSVEDYQTSGFFAERVELPSEITTLADLIAEELDKARHPQEWGFLPERVLPLVRKMNKLHRLAAAYLSSNISEIKFFI
ncbi:hypothetical protein HZC30_01710 [Candidatus Woesearchaeota archaeon]|nr:hypothetical protein [Candidatus Woesearchaeota archaeon]